MSVRVTYWGQFGNNIFQYCAARRFARKNNLQLLTEWKHPCIFPATPYTAGVKLDEPFRKLLDTQEDLLDRPFPPGAYHLEGYFHQHRWYDEHLDEIKSFFVIPKMQHMGDDLAVHLRLGDYRDFGPGRAIIDPRWYVDLIEKIPHRKLWIVAQEWNDRYMAAFSRLQFEFVSGSRETDFLFLMAFKKMICSNSTFCWWAAKLGHATQVWTFKPWIKGTRGDLAFTKNAVPVDGGFWDEGTEQKQ